MISRCFIINLLLINYFHFNSYFALGQDTLYYKGCYTEKSIEARLMPDVFKVLDTLTPEKCLSECRGHNYFGLQIGQECFCSHKWPSYKYSVKEEDCNTPCVGDRSKTCGGVFRLSIYETREVERNFVESNYIGCMDTSRKKILIEKSKNFQNRLTPEICVAYCYRTGHRFAGLQAGECACGNPDLNLIKRSLVDKAECNKKCGNGKFICGGNLRSSIYNTGITEHSEDERLIGCFEDGDRKLLTAYSMKYPDNNSPKLCYNVCVGSGYKYAGTKNSIECYCGNLKPSAALRRGEQDCGIPCPGDPFSDCGGTSTMLVYEINVSGVGEPDSYYGCYEDNPKYILPSLISETNHNNSPEVCISLCRNAGFKYAGVEVGYNCVCGNDKPEDTLLKPEADCSQDCPGAPTKGCGGTWRLKLYSTGVLIPRGKAYYKGCYKERSIPARLLFDIFENRGASLSPELCIRECREKGFSYVGLQVGHECFCSNTWPSYKYSTEEEDCTTPCEGDRSQKCGAPLRLNIYETYEITKNQVEKNYIGCMDESNKELVNEISKIFPDKLTPEICVAYCFRRGFRFAGVKSSECKCGDTDINVIKKNLVSDSQCIIKCGNNGKFICGGQSKSSVYSTEIAGDSEADGLLGCYEESPIGLLTGFAMKYPENNSPKLCFNVCSGSGYKYAGVKNGDECLCGNIKPDNKYKKSKKDCEKFCPGGSNKVCGGDNRIVIYTTKAQGDLNGYLGCYEDSPERLLPEVKKDFPDNSPELCMNYCRAAHYKYIGLQVGAECFCGNNKPLDKFFKPEADCYFPCRGAKNMGCGGHWRLKVFDISDREKRSAEVCTSSATEVNNRKACKGQLVFEEDFLNEISPDKWRYEVQMPVSDFVILNNKAENVFIKDGKLFIKPSILGDDFVRHGEIKLDNCTGEEHHLECVQRAFAFLIIPPIQSGKITTKESFSFKYGKIEVRAKLPKGDWIVPQIWLEPKSNLYGPNLSSGRIKIALSRGNKNLVANGKEIGSTKLESGILIGVNSKVKTKSVLRDNSEAWYTNFHNYTLTWTPDNLKFSVDNGPEENLISPGESLIDVLGFDKNITSKWKSDSSIAPFDQEFYITLGLSAGGMEEFPDGSVSGINPKPWRNLHIKAMFNFWKDRHQWEQTWEDDKSALQIEHVRVTAI